MCHLLPRGRWSAHRKEGFQLGKTFLADAFDIHQFFRPPEATVLFPKGNNCKLHSNLRIYNKFYVFIALK